jgi:Sugar kinases, ribokinase family
MRQIIGIGETILDVIFKNEEPHKAVPGGSVFNGLVSLGRLGVPVTFISEIGNDRVGDIIEKFMKDNNISTQFVNRFPDGKTPVSLAFLDSDNNADYVFYKDYPKQRLDVAFPPINKDDIFIFGSFYALNPTLRERIVDFVEYARDRKAIIYYDINFRKTHSHEAIKLMPTVIENLEYADIVRGSDEDWYNLFKETDVEKIYDNHISFYCKKFITTHGANGVNLFNDEEKKHFDVPQIETLSTIGAGDNFNAGILFGLLKYNIGYDDIKTVSMDMWDKIISCGIEFSAEACKSYDNYIPKDSSIERTPSTT